MSKLSCKTVQMYNQMSFTTAWVNFDGTGTITIASSGGVSSVVDNGTGLYLVNFTKEMVHSDYSLSTVCRSMGSKPVAANTYLNDQPQTTGVKLDVRDTNLGTEVDSSMVSVAVYGGRG